MDGFLARRLGQVSELGKILDPTADRILLGVGVVAIMIDGSVPLWLGIVVLAREALVSGAVLALAAAGARRIDVQWAGKAGTFSLMFAFPLFLVAHSTAGWQSGRRRPGLALRHPRPGSSAGTPPSPMCPSARRALAEGRAGRAAKVAVTRP